jgi:hypothetical protein
MIYQWNESQTFVRKYGALWEIQRDTGFLMDDVLKAMKFKYALGGYYFTRTPMLEVPKETPTQLDNNRNLRHNVKMSLMISEELVDEFIKQVGQRNKQDIIRGLIADWVKKEKKIAVSLAK